MSTKTVKLEQIEGRRSSSSSSIASSSSSRSSKRDWTDEEPITDCPADAPKKKKRTKAPKRFMSDKDYNRFDRPDMFVNSIFPYMGLYLAPDSTRKPTTLPASSLPNKNSKIIRISVEGGVVATGAELFGSLQKAILESKDQSQLPSTVNFKGQSLSLEYAPPHGDELQFGSHSQDSSWIGMPFSIISFFLLCHLFFSIMSSLFFYYVISFLFYQVKIY